VPTKTGSSARRQRYSVHPGVAMMVKWVAELKEKTGRSVEEWVRLIKKEGPRTEPEQREWLKSKYALGTNSAWWLAARASGASTGEEDTPEGYLKAAEQYVKDQYAGAKAGLKPIYEALLECAFSIAKDVKACPCKTMVPLYRNHVFAEIKPAAKDRIDLGLALKDHPFSKRLLDTGGQKKKDRITHKIALTSLSDIDAEVKKLLKKAYDLDAK
jgi:hypothetical protein